jgi:hypothetical protein
LPRNGGRPFHPLSGAQKDPASGFLTIPREVVLGLGQVVPRWGAIDFQIQSGDVMHFDDRYGIGKPFFDAIAPAKVKVAAENKAGQEAFDKKQAEKAEEKKAEEKKDAGSGSATQTPQRKAILGSPDDPLEREADEMANRVMRADPPAPARIQPSPGTVLRTHTVGLSETENAVMASHSGGAPLPSEARSCFEPRFGHDFSTVRVHTGSDAAEGAGAIQARAYTVGRDVVFGSGEYALATFEGRRLLAHELAHVVQQRGGASPGVVRRNIRPADVSVELVGQKSRPEPDQGDGVSGIADGNVRRFHERSHDKRHHDSLQHTPGD